MCLISDRRDILEQANAQGNVISCVACLRMMISALQKAFLEIRFLCLA